MSTSLLLLELPGVIGDCSISGFTGHITLESFSWGLSSATRAVKDSKDKAKASVSFDQLQVSKFYDSSSIQLCNLMGNDKELQNGVTLRFVDPMGAKFEPVMEMKFEKVYIENISIRTSESSKAMSVTEDVVFSFQRVELEYFSYDPAKRSRTSGGDRFFLSAPDKDPQ
jgi:type VI protein secretion system component Hcp